MVIWFLDLDHCLLIYMKRHKLKIEIQLVYYLSVGPIKNPPINASTPEWNDLPLISGQSIFQNGEKNDLKVSSLSAKEAKRRKAPSLLRKNMLLG
jgi:hypothetical protein